MFRANEGKLNLKDLLKHPLETTSWSPRPSGVKCDNMGEGSNERKPQVLDQLVELPT